MNWEDTFLSNSKLLEIYGKPDFTERQGKEKQAEVSFKAGQAEGYHEGFPDGVKDGYGAGIMEMVEWIRGVNKSGDFYYSFDQAELEAKLKECGI